MLKMVSFEIAWSQLHARWFYSYLLERDMGLVLLLCGNIGTLKGRDAFRGVVVDVLTRGQQFYYL